MTTLIFALATILLHPAAALAISGKSADGCTYKVINGQYLHSCDTKPADTVKLVSAAPVTSYSDIPVRSEAPLASGLAQTSAAAVVQSVPSQGLIVDQAEADRHQRRIDKVVDATYAGANVGSTTVKESGSSTGLGITVGTLIDEHFGVELGYSYAKQDLSLGLAERGEARGVLAPYGNDSRLSTHLLSGEVQAHLTNALKRLRPYLGAGLGWKSASLEEKSTYALANQSAGKLSQSSFGALGTAGAKLRVGQAVYLGFAFRYFFPLARQTARLEQPQTVSFAPAQSSRLSAEDDRLTGSSQYQLLGGLQVAF